MTMAEIQATLAQNECTRTSLAVWQGTTNTDVDVVRQLLDRYTDFAVLHVPDQTYTFNRSNDGDRVLNMTMWPLHKHFSPPGQWVEVQIGSRFHGVPTREVDP